MSEFNDCFHRQKLLCLHCIVPSLRCSFSVFLLLRENTLSCLNVRTACTKAILLVDYFSDNYYTLQIRCFHLIWGGSGNFNILWSVSSPSVQLTSKQILPKISGVLCASYIIWKHKFKDFIMPCHHHPQWYLSFHNIVNRSVLYGSSGRINPDYLRQTWSARSPNSWSIIS